MIQTSKNTNLQIKTCFAKKGCKSISILQCRDGKDSYHRKEMGGHGNLHFRDNRVYVWFLLQQKLEIEQVTDFLTQINFAKNLEQFFLPSLGPLTFCTIII